MMRIRTIVSLCVLSLALGSCDSFDFYGLLAGAGSGRQQGGALGISPISVTVAVSGACTFTATGGVPPYQFSVTSGTGTIDKGTGIYRAPAAPSSTVVQVKDSAGGMAEASVMVTL